MPATVPEPPVVTAQEPPPLAPLPVAAPISSAAQVRISSSDFKGGLVAVLDGGNSFSDALPQLMALDFAHSAQSRGYWWCGQSSSGGPRMFSRAGLPDPYFFTRMLMWPGQ
jgi:hypothetical protein